MREHLEKLLALLEHKHDVLGELIDGQSALKRYLINPSWTGFLEMTRPQEALLNRLRQIQSAQDYLLGELAKRLRLRGKITLKGLCPCLDGEWRRPLLERIERIRTAVLRLRELNRLSGVLHQAQVGFLRRAQALEAGPEVSGDVYTPQGLTRPVYSENRFVREV